MNLGVRALELDTHWVEVTLLAIMLRYQQTEAHRTCSMLIES